MNNAQELKLAWYVSGKNFLESKGIDCSGWTNEYRAITYGWEFAVFDDKGNRVVHIYCMPDKGLAEFTYRDDDPVAAGLADIFKRA